MLELNEVSKHFGKLIAVNDISLQIGKGEIRGLIGPNGSGKTTIFNLITGFLKPTNGSIKWEGEDIAGKSTHLIARRGIVRTFQMTSIYRELSVLENVKIGSHISAKLMAFRELLRLRKVFEEDKRLETMAVSTLEMMGIDAEKHRRAGELSGGKQKVLAIATALSAGPKLLMLDEPTAGLNTAEKLTMIAIIKKIRDKGITVLLVEHDMKTIMSTCDRITVINFGKKIAEGSPDMIANDEKTIEAYLGKPGGHLA